VERPQSPRRSSHGAWSWQGTGMSRQGGRRRRPQVAWTRRTRVSAGQGLALTPPLPLPLPLRLVFLAQKRARPTTRAGAARA
jgi:hypothetical protein